MNSTAGARYLAREIQAIEQGAAMPSPRAEEVIQSSIATAPLLDFLSPKSLIALADCMGLTLREFVGQNGNQVQ